VRIVVEIHSKADLARLLKEPDLHIVVYSGRMKVGRLTQLSKLIAASLRIRSVGLHVLLYPSTGLMEDPGGA
jgi:hypothetical protein